MHCIFKFKKMSVTEYKSKVSNLCIELLGAYRDRYIDYTEAWHEVLHDILLKKKHDRDFTTMTIGSLNQLCKSSGRYYKEQGNYEEILLSTKDVIHELETEKVKLAAEVTELESLVKSNKRKIMKKNLKLQEQRLLLKTYKGLTGIDLQENSKILEGYIFNEKTGTIHPFAMSSNNPDSTEYLWRNMEELFLK